MIDKDWVRDVKKVLVLRRALEKEKKSLNEQISRTKKRIRELDDMLINGKVYKQA